MPLVITVILFFFAATSDSQVFDGFKTKYDSVSSDINSRNSFQREKWFYEQRIYPSSTIPEFAFSDAFEEKLSIRNTSGFYDKVNEWISLGPTPAVNTYYNNVSSRVVSVKYDPSNPEVIYLGAAYGGIWKTTNSGLNWFPKSDFEVTLSSGAIAIDPANTNIVYYGTGEATYFTYSYSGRGLLKSTDAGNSWVNYTSGLPAETYFSRLVIKPGNPNVLFAALGISGLYKSLNAGESWVQLIAGRCDDIIFSPDGSRAYCIGQGTGYRISIDGGETFSAYTPFPLGTRNHIAVCRLVPSVLYSAVYQGTTASVYRSTNSGVDFTLLQNNFTGANQGWYDFYVHADPFNPNIAFVGLVDLWRTMDGSTFTKITNTSAGPVHVDHHNLDFHPTVPGKLICANDGGVWSSANYGTNWTNLNSTLNLTQFYRITSDPSNSMHIMGGTQDNGIQRTTGSPIWNVLIFGGDGGDVCFHSVDNNYILAENQFNRIKRSVNGGLSWSTDTTGLFGSAAWVAPIISHPDSAGIFYTARQQLFKSIDYGDNWFPYSTGTTGAIRELSISGSDPEKIYAVTGISLYLSTNGGITFINRAAGLPNRVITGVCIHPDSSNVSLVSLSGFGGGHIFKTTNSGLSWFDVSGNLPDIPANDVLIYYPGHSTPIVLAATDIGVFVSSDFGITWSELAAGLPNTVSIHLDHNRQQNILRVGTHGRGVWEYDGSILGINKVEATIPQAFSLLQNYPNPFNPGTIIRLKIKDPGLATLKIFDILGREVVTLVNQQLSPGTYEVEWDAAKFPSGVYFYRLVSGDFMQMKKMVLIK